MKNNGRMGLVLEGGGMRGIYTTGVLDVFMEQGISFDGVIGVSAGAIHGSSYVANQKGRNIRYYKNYASDKRMFGYRSLIFTGNIANVKFCYDVIPNKLDPFDYDAFEASGTEFYAVCSNVETGKPEYIKIDDMRAQINALRASASLPFVSKIVPYAGMKLLDGGYTDSIPLAAFRNLGFGTNVVVLTQHAGFVKEPENVEKARRKYRQYPAFAEALATRHVMYNDELALIRELEAAGEIFVIQPSEPLNISQLCGDPKELQRVHDIGRKDATAKLEDLRVWLEEKQHTEV